MTTNPDVRALSLREAVLCGRCDGTSPDDPEGFELSAFLGQDEGALRRWFGSTAAAELVTEPRRLRGLIDRDLSVIDQMLSAQLDAVLHHSRFQRFEGRWRGLAWLVQRFEPGSRLKVLLLSATWRELERDLTRTVEFDQSNLFRLVYESEFGRAGGEPFGLLVVDHEVRHRPERRRAGDVAPIDDISVMAALAAVAAAAFAPIVLAASPALLGVDRFEDLVLSHEATNLLSGPDHARWRALVASEDARFLCVTMPRVLARPRWGRPLGSAWYEEHAPTARERPWFVAGYAFAAAVGRSHVAQNWPADIRGVSTDRVGGGLILDLPADPFRFGAETEWARSSLELGLTDQQERDLVLAGLMPLNTLPHGDAVFASVHSLQTRQPNMPGRDASPHGANRRISAQISAILCASRFAHYVKTIGRELTGSFADAAEIERRLARWLSGYTNASQSPTPDSRARHPLVSSSVQVQEIPGRPGSFGCVIHLQPYHQLDDVSTTFRLVTAFGSSREAA